MPWEFFTDDEWDFSSRLQRPTGASQKNNNPVN
jgi:hypothetical protein